jgi:hypothetical protein
LSPTASASSSVAQSTPTGAGGGTPEPTTAPAAPATPEWTSVVVQATTVLEPGQSVQSNRTRLVMGNDGNLVIFDEYNRMRWTSNTAGLGGYRAAFQADGNLVVYNASWQGLWTSGTAGHDGAVLVLESDGNVCVVDRSTVIWASNTAH